LPAKTGRFRVPEFFGRHLPEAHNGQPFSLVYLEYVSASLLAQFAATGPDRMIHSHNNLSGTSANFRGSRHFGPRYREVIEALCIVLFNPEKSFGIEFNEFTHLCLLSRK
jgi:hypothetical protein